MYQDTLLILIPNNTITDNDSKEHSDISKHRHNLRGKKRKCPPPFFLPMECFFFGGGLLN